MKLSTISADGEVISTKQVYWKVHTPNFLKELSENPQVGPAVTGLGIMGKILYAIAERAVELGDEELLSLCCRLTLYDSADLLNKQEYDPKVSELISKWDEKLIERLSK